MFSSTIKKKLVKSPFIHLSFFRWWQNSALMHICAAILRIFIFMKNKVFFIWASLHVNSTVKLAHICTLISVFVIPSLEGIISNLASCKISIF